MEFKFREVDDRTPPFLPSSTYSPGLSYFSEQALRANHTKAPNFMPNAREFYTIQLEIEKERIRQEITENVRQRVLEEEVRTLRRELMMEREMTMHGASRTGLSIDERLTMQIYSRYPLMHQFNNPWLKDRSVLPGNRNLAFGHNILPPILGQFSNAAKDEIKSSLDFTQKDKMIILAKPDPNHCGAKRKATAPPVGSLELSLVSLKKPKEWSCALCQVSATSEQGLNEHLQGKKHKAKEAGLLRAQKMCNNSASQAKKYKKSRKQIKLSESQDGTGSELQTKEAEESSHQADKSVIALDQKMEGVEDSKSETKELPKKKNLNAENQKKNATPVTESVKGKQANKKKYKFWCDDCQVGTHTAVVMEAHKKGKKHMARLKESNQNGEAVLKESNQNSEPVSTTTTTMIVATSEATEDAKDIDVVAKEFNEETTENVIGDSDGSGSSTVADAADVKNQTP